MAKKKEDEQEDTNTSLPGDHPPDRRPPSERTFSPGGNPEQLPGNTPVPEEWPEYPDAMPVPPSKERKD